MSHRKDDYALSISFVQRADNFEKTVSTKLARFVTSVFVFLWSQIKENVCRNIPRNLDELKANINILSTTFQAVSTDMFRRARLSMQHAGAHFQNTL
jgi:hypothetical protein